jgi:hypothetical protein
MLTLAAGGAVGLDGGAPRTEIPLVSSLPVTCSANALALPRGGAISRFTATIPLCRGLLRPTGTSAVATTSAGLAGGLLF